MSIKILHVLCKEYVFVKNDLFVSLRRSQIIGRFEEGQNIERMDTSSSNEPSTNTTLIQRQGRSERRYLANKQVCDSICLSRATKS